MRNIIKMWIHSVSIFIALISCCSICQIWGNFLAMNSKGLYVAESRYLEFTSSWKREIRHFHVVVVQRRKQNLPKTMMHVQSCCFAYLILLLFCRPTSSPGRFSMALEEKRPGDEAVCRPRCLRRRSVDGSWSLGYFFSSVSASEKKCSISASRQAR